jgi:uncharacterized protein YukE
VSVLGNPAAIEALAMTLDRRADDLSDVGRRVRQRAESSSQKWICARADRFRWEMQERQRQAEAMARELHDIARQLLAVANRVRAEIAFLGGLERRVRDLVRRFPAGSATPPPWAGTRWSPRNLPRSGDPAWRDVARVLGVRYR